MGKALRLERDSSYGRHLWLGSRVRLGSPGKVTAMWPWVYRSYDEYCNDVFTVKLWPLGRMSVWWRRQQRTRADGLCADCRAEFGAVGACGWCGCKPCSETCWTLENEELQAWTTAANRSFGTDVPVAEPRANWENNPDFLCSSEGWGGRKGQIIAA